jgi:transposase-like protein
MNKRVKKSGVASADAEVKRWSANRKKEVVLRVLRGEALDALSRELGIETYRLECWRG